MVYIHATSNSCAHSKKGKAAKKPALAGPHKEETVGVLKKDNTKKRAQIQTAKSKAPASSHMILRVRRGHAKSKFTKTTKMAPLSQRDA